MSYQLIEYVAVVEIEGEQHILKATGVPSYTIVKKHIEQIPGVKVLRLEKCDSANPIAHIERVKKELEEKFPDQEPMTPERLAEISNRTIEAQNEAAGAV